MDSTSPSTQATPSTPGDDHPSSANHDQYRVVRKRNRVPLSCAPCRARKLKCNRTNPCENCTKRGEAATCSYAAPGVRKKASSKSQPSGTPDDMQNRIDKLEGLVLSLMSSGRDPVSPAAANRTMSMSTMSNSQAILTPSTTDESHREASVESETDKVAKSFGVLHFNNNQASYIGDSHWATILHEISEVKTYFKDHQKQYEDALKTVEATRRQQGTISTGPAFLLASRKPPDFKELLNRLPRKSEVDQLVQRHFADHDPMLSILHMPTWQQQYEQYWQNPNRSSASFLGQLFAICRLAMQSYYKNEDEPQEYQGRTRDLAAMYRGLTQSCLELVDYTKIEQSTIETLILHLVSEYHKSGDTDIGIWVLSRTVISLAMRAGLHLDGKNFADITPFAIEMRRRLWAFLRVSDTMGSFAVALPSMIRAGDTDTQMPANLRDEDFGPEMEVLPPSRPRGKLTDVSYLIAKAELAVSFSRITALITGTGKISYEEVVSLDREIRDVYHGMFPDLQAKNSENLQESSRILVMRMNLSILYNKALCVLHRKYLTLARENSRFNLSRQSCIDASLALLRTQQMLDKESRIGGRMHRSQYQIATLMTHDFILAGTLVSLDLLGSVQAEAAGRKSGDIEIWGYDRKEEQIQSIESARAIWDGLKDHYVEAYKAHSICGVMIQKVQQCLQQTNPQNGNGSGIQYPTFAGQRNSADKSEHSAAMTLGMLSGGGAAEWKQTEPLNQINGQYLATTQPSTGLTPNYPMDTAMLNNGNNFPFFSGVVGETPANMDWNAWDEYMQNPNLDVPLNGDVWPSNFDILNGNFDASQLTNGIQQGQLDNSLFANPESETRPGMAS